MLLLIFGFGVLLLVLGEETEREGHLNVLWVVGEDVVDVVDEEYEEEEDTVGGEWCGCG